MAIKDKWIVSVDDHIIEPTHLWDTWMPQKFKDQAPKYVRDDDGEGWLYNGEFSPYQQLTAAAGFDAEELSPFPITMEEMRPGSYDPKARVADMNTNQVLSSVVFPTFSGLCGNRFFESGDLEVGKECIRAYNDFLLQEWSASQPGRFVPIMLVPFWDIEASVKEVERCVPLGAKAIAFSENPTLVTRRGDGPKSMPSIHDRGRYWDPLLSIANETKTPLCIHIASVTSPMTTSRDAPAHVGACVARVVSPEMCVFDWLFSGNLQRFPDLNILLSEGGIGWIPAALEAADYQFSRHGAHLSKYSYDTTTQGGFSVPKQIETKMSNEREFSPDFMPSDLFRRQMYGCYFHNEPGLARLEEIGVDNVMIEVDFPHSDSTWPHTMKLAEQTLGDKPEVIQDKVMFGNAARVFNLDIEKTLATVTA